MSSSDHQRDTAPHADWRELERRMSEFAKLARADGPFDQLADVLVEHLHELLDPQAVAVWQLDASDEWQPISEGNLSAIHDATTAAKVHRCLREAATSGRVQTIPPRTSADDPNPTPHFLVVSPMLIDQDVVALVTVWQRGDIDSEALLGTQRVVSLLAELAAEHLRRNEVRRLRVTQNQWQQYDDFLVALHQHLDPNRVCGELANEGRRHLNCDRVAVAVRRGANSRIAAVSAVERINRRSPSIRLLERLIDVALQSGEAFWYESARDGLAPQVELALTEYLDESHAVSLAVIPLQHPSGPADSLQLTTVGALVIENFAPRQRGDHERALQVARQGGLALANALRFRWLPTLPLVRRQFLAGEPTRWRLKLLATLAGALLLGSTFIIPVDHNVYAVGELQPVTRSHVFAPLDGRITEINVAHGDTVAAGAGLLQMTSPTLDLELQKVQGEHDATLERSRAIESILLDDQALMASDPQRASQLAAEQEELRQLFASQQRQLEMLAAQRALLQVKSPIDGEVLTWQADELLANRPVRQGQRLLTIADYRGDWQADVSVPDDEVGPLLERLTGSTQPLQGTISVAGYLDQHYAVQFDRIAQRAEMNSDDKPIVHVILAIDDAQLPALRAGTTVYAKLPCGQRSLFYVWCHDLIDAVRGWWNFSVI